MNVPNPVDWSTVKAGDEVWVVTVFNNIKPEYAKLKYTVVDPKMKVLESQGFPRIVYDDLWVFYTERDATQAVVCKMRAIAEEFELFAERVQLFVDNYEEETEVGDECQI